MLKTNDDVLKLLEYIDPSPAIVQSISEEDFQMNTYLNLPNHKFYNLVTNLSKILEKFKVDKLKWLGKNNVN